DRVVVLESEKAKEVLGPLDVTDHDRHVVEVFDHDPSSPRPYSPTAWHLKAWSWPRPPRRLPHAISNNKHASHQSCSRQERRVWRQRTRRGTRQTPGALPLAMTTPANTPCRRSRARRMKSARCSGRLSLRPIIARPFATSSCCR